MKKVLFLHGLESRPGGAKPNLLKKEGYQVFNPHLPKSSFDESIKIAQDIVDLESPDVVVGSSRGGAVAMCLNLKGAKLVLIAPAWKHFSSSTEKTITEKNMILHSEHDTVVEWNDSAKLALASGSDLVTIGKDHRMNDPDAHEGLLDAVKWVSRDA